MTVIWTVPRSTYNYLFIYDYCVCVYVLVNNYYDVYMIVCFILFFNSIFTRLHTSTGVVVTAISVQQHFTRTLELF